MSEVNTKECLDHAIQCAIQAGELVLETYESGQFEQYNKSDDSPVTCADIAAHEFIEGYLSKYFPSTPIMSEEQEHLGLSERVGWKRYWLVDPIDGTQEFVSRSGDFAVNIALVEDNQPVLGVIYWPTTGITYYATLNGGAWRMENGESAPIHVRRLDVPAADKIIVAVSRVQPLETVMNHLSDTREYETLRRGSCSLKACAIAEGSADIYMRVGITGEWDTGAAQCIVSEAGGRIVDKQFEPLSYNQREQLSNPDFLILGDQDVDWQHIVS